VKKITLKNFEFKTSLGSVASDVDVWVEPGYDPKTFQNKNDFSIDDGEVERLTDEIVFKFLKKNTLDVLEKKRRLTGDEIRSIMNYMKLTTNEQFSILVGHDKSKISKAKRDEEQMSFSACIAAMNFLFSEYKSSGYCRRILGLDPLERREDKNLPWASEQKKLA
jgi:hypothetical protein